MHIACIYLYMYMYTQVHAYTLQRKTKVTVALYYLHMYALTFIISLAEYLTHSALISLKIQLSGKNVLTSSSATMGSSGVGWVGGATISPSGPNNLKCKIHIIFLRSILFIYVHLGRILK